MDTNKQKVKKHSIEYKNTNLSITVIEKALSCFFVIFSFFWIALIGITNAAMNVNALASCIMYEASIGNPYEQRAIDFAYQ